MFKVQILGCFLAIFFACQQSSPNSATAIPKEDTTKEAEESAPLLEIDLMQAKAESLLENSKIVAISYDPVFKRAKKYEAIPLKPYLKQLINTQNLDTTNTEIIFLCKDGYNPGMALSKVLKSEPYLAIKDLEAPAGKNWMDTLQGKWPPFYLIWTNHAKGDKGFTWPYGLAYLQFKASDAAYKAAFPTDVTKVAGFELYKEKCMKCHSVNMVGGVLGPEMNVPKNITEYWQKEDIFAFVKNPYSYRYNSKMPPVAGISDAQLEQIYTYLQYMKGHKVQE